VVCHNSGMGVLIPGWVPPILFDTETLERLGPCGVRVGNRVEIDLDQAAQVLSPTEVARLDCYATHVAGFVPRPGTKEAVVVVSRPLLKKKQQDNTQGKVDLLEEVQGFNNIPVVAQLVTEILGPDPSWDTLGYRFGLLNVTVEPHKSFVKTSFEVPSPAKWVLALGGGSLPNELFRRVEITSSHAKWRKRRARRLVELHVYAVEVWPDPQQVCLSGG